VKQQIAERYRGLYDRTQPYPSFQPPLDDLRWRTVPSGVERARGPVLQSDREGIPWPS
jgi:hypothetical protein